MALSQQFSENDLLASILSGNLPTGHLTQRSDSQQVRGIPIDVVETSNAFQIAADIPGVDKKDIKLNVDGDVLSLSVQKSESKKDSKSESGYKFHRTERSSTFVRRSLRLPEHADLSKVSAKYVDGVLQVEVPKSQEERTRNVQIQ